MNNEEILERFKRDQANKRTLFPELKGMPSQPIKPDTVVEELKAPKPHKKTLNKQTGLEKNAIVVKLLPQKILLTIAVTIVVVGLAGGAYTLIDSRPSNAEKEKTTQQAKDVAASLSLYSPESLPPNYTYNNDKKVLKSDVYYFSITGPNEEVFHITQQPIPDKFDFVAFNKKFSNPDTFTTSAGIVTAGPVGPSMLASIRTSKNTWIIINASENVSLSELETVARSLN